jgi:hypothetical protein
MKNLTIVDQQTGEVIEPEAVEASTQFLSLLNEMGFGDRRILLQDQLLTLSVVEENQLDVFELFNQEALSFADVTNQKLMVHGAVLFEFEPTIKADGTAVPRYFQCRVLVDLDGELRVIKSSGQNLLRHVVHLCKKNGWYMFAEPIEYRFVWKGAGKPHLMERVGRKYIVPKSQRETSNGE